MTERSAGWTDPVYPVQIYQAGQIQAVDGVADGDSSPPRCARETRPANAPAWDRRALRVGCSAAPLAGLARYVLDARTP